MDNEKYDFKEGDSEPSEVEKVLGSMPSFEEFRRTVEEESNGVSGLNEIAEKYGYNEELKKTLEMIVPEIADYYDNLDGVLKVLDECPIFMVEPGKKSSEAANKYFGTNEELPTLASGGTSTVPRITEDGQLEVRKGIVLRGGDKRTLQTLVHEICHQVASINKEPRLEPDGRIKVDTGLSSEYYGMGEDGAMKLVGSKWVYLEEMMNAYDTEMIMRGIKGDNYKSDEYGILRAIAYNCPADVIQKLERLRIQGVDVGDSVDYEKLDGISSILDDIMIVPRKISLSNKMAGGDREKAKEIRREMDQRNVEKAINGLNSF